MNLQQRAEMRPYSTLCTDITRATGEYLATAFAVLLLRGGYI